MFVVNIAFCGIATAQDYNWNLFFFSVVYSVSVLSTKFVLSCRKRIFELVAKYDSENLQRACLEGSWDQSSAQFPRPWWRQRVVISCDGMAAADAALCPTRSRVGSRQRSSDAHDTAFVDQPTRHSRYVRTSKFQTYLLSQSRVGLAVF